MAGVYEKISSAGYMQPNICKHLIKLSLVGNPMQLRHVGKKKHGQNDLLKFKPSIRMEKKCDLKDYECDCWCETGWSEYFTVDRFRSSHTASPGFTENGPKMRTYPVSGSSLAENDLLTPDIRGEWPDCKVYRRACLNAEHTTPQS